MGTAAAKRNLPTSGMSDIVSRTYIAFPGAGLGRGKLAPLIAVRQPETALAKTSLQGSVMAARVGFARCSQSESRQRNACVPSNYCIFTDCPRRASTSCNRQ